MEDKWKNKNLVCAFKNAINGIITALKSQTNLKIQIVIAFIAVVLGFLFKFNINDFIILTITIFIVFITEMINTAIEAFVDLCTIEYNEKARLSKDIAAGAVTLSAVNSIIVGCLLFVGKLIK